MNWWRALAVVASLALAAGVVQFAVRTNDGARPPAPRPEAPPPGSYVGATTCATCHAKEYEGWKGSHHDLSMQQATEQSVLGDFHNATFDSAGIRSTFFRRDGRFFVKTDGPDGTLTDFEIKYTFGVAPLQQYLIEFPDGRIQALSIAWDARGRERGGQRWFHLYAGQAIKAGNRLHWTGIDQNWNFQCADCHSTNLRKNFDSQRNTFKTTWSEIDVSCEACHGPGSNHVAWAKRDANWEHLPGKGLALALDERRSVTWTVDAVTGNARRSVPRNSQRELEICARCHSRRSQFSDDFVYGRPLADTHQVTPLEAGLYYVDGQMRDEVYNHGSFVQSKMFARGVTCSDCHEPHTLQLRAPGNAVCAQCHRAAKYDTVGHSHHRPGTAGSQCAACHMPTRTYMTIDSRHDHSLRIPRPDRSVTLGVPNACNQCHADRTPQWAAKAVRGWYPEPLAGYQRFAEALNAGTHSTAGGRGLLIAVADDATEPAIGRASALALLARYPGPRTADVLRGALNDADPLVRVEAIGALAGAAPGLRAQSLFPLLADPVRSVRIAAASALADVPQQGVGAEQRAALAAGLDEYVAAQRFEADRPEAHGNLGTLYAERGEYEAATSEFRQALAIDPTWAPAAVNLADLYRSRGDEANAEATLRTALKLNGGDASLQHALGLTLVRRGRVAEAVAALKEAARLAPEQPRYTYVYAVALNSVGRQAQAIDVLTAAQRRFTGDEAILQALVTMERDRGHMDAARSYARKLDDLARD